LFQAGAVSNELGGAGLAALVVFGGKAIASSFSYLLFVALYLGPLSPRSSRLFLRSSFREQRAGYPLRCLFLIGGRSGRILFILEKIG